MRTGVHKKVREQLALHTHGKPPMRDSVHSAGLSAYKQQRLDIRRLGQHSLLAPLLRHAMGRAARGTEGADGLPQLRDVVQALQGGVHVAGVS